MWSKVSASATRSRRILDADKTEAVKTVCGSSQAHRRSRRCTWAGRKTIIGFGGNLDRSTAPWLAVIGFSLLGATALYSCVPYIEKDLLERATAAAGADAAPVGWAHLRVDGQDLVLSGVAPTAAHRASLLERLEDIEGVTSVEDQATSLAEGDLTHVPSTPSSAPAVDSPVDSAVDSPVVSPDLTSVPAPESAATDPLPERLPGPPGTDEPALAGGISRCQQDIDELLTNTGSFFQSGGAAVVADAVPVIELVARRLNACGVPAEVAGHTDNSGRSVPNQALSLARAEAIRDQLVLAGVPAGNLQAKGYGEDRPIVSNRTPEGRRQNRRIEIRLVASVPATLAGPPTESIQ